MTRRTCRSNREKFRQILRVVLAMSGIAAAATSAIAHHGGLQDGAAPQSAVPLGTPAAPPPPQFDDTAFRDAVFAALQALDTPAEDAMPEAKAVRAAILKRDARISLKNLPSRAVASANK